MTNALSPTAIIVDDEAPLRDYLQRQLAYVWPELAMLAHAKNGREAIELVQRHQPAVVFLDIRMPGLNGIQVVQHLPPDTRVVFVTAYDEYAVAAFEHAAIDYLLKPVRLERLEKTVQKLKTTLSDTSPPNIDTQTLHALITQLAGKTPPRSTYLQWLRVGKGDTTELIPVSEVVYCRADNKYTSAFTPSAEHLLRTPLKVLATELDPSQFWRVHRNTIVNVNDIQSASRDLRGCYQLALKRRRENLRSSRTYAHLFKQM